MQTVSVIPITKNISTEELTYYSTEEVSTGDIVSVPLRRKQIPALVTNVSDVKSKKVELKTASFSLRKILKLHTKAPFTPALMKAVQKCTEYFATTTGLILNTVIPKAILTEIPPSHTLQTNDTQHSVNVLQNTDDIRHSYYKGLARELFAKKRSLFITLPTQAEAQLLYEKVKHGISDNTVLLHTGMTQKKQRELWQQILKEEHPLLIVATPQFLSLPRTDIGTIVVEREHSRHYKTQTRPYLDYRTYTQLLAQNMKIPIIWGDELVRFETLRQLQTNLITPLSRPTMQYGTDSNVDVIDMRSPSHSFAAVSSELKEMIESIQTPIDRCFIFSLRKGLYPQTVCADCGHLVTCTHCDAPVVVHVQKTADSNTNVFACHRCGRIRSAEEHCSHCNSWNLKPLGVATERIEQELRQHFPDAPIIRAETHKDVIKWQKTPKGILIGTEMILPYLEETSHIAVASLDTLFSLPDFRARERIFRTLTILRNRSSQRLLIQTRNKDEGVFDHAQSGNVLAWYKKELEERKELEYPPFTTLIKISTAGSKKMIETYVTDLESKLEKYTPHSFSAFTPRVRGKNIMHTLIALPEGGWPDKELVEILQKLPLAHAIHVDPEHLL